MGPLEIIVIVGAAAIVIGVVASSIAKRVKAKKSGMPTCGGCCDCCSGCGKKPPESHKNA